MNNTGYFQIIKPTLHDAAPLTGEKGLLCVDNDYAISEKQKFRDVRTHSASDLSRGIDISGRRFGRSLFLNVDFALFASQEQPHLQYQFLIP